eukprot:6162182-Pyramimonas_sp.AAC.1
MFTFIVSISSLGCKDRKLRNMLDKEGITPEGRWWSELVALLDTGTLRTASSLRRFSAVIFP